MEDTDSDESEGEAVSDEDPDWQKTPLFKRIKKLKETQSFMATAGGANGKKRRLEDGGEGDEEDENQTPESNDDTFTRYSGARFSGLRSNYIFSCSQTESTILR